MVKTTPQIAVKLRHLPDQPGVYLWKNSEHQIIYVGKALNLANRIRSYLTDTAKDAKTEQLVKNIADLEYIIVNNEAEAFLLEANLIKEHKPKYNILLKDDKRYPFIKITVNELYPRIILTRDLQKEGGRYFGPFTDAKSLRRTLRLLEWVFPIRNCTRHIADDRIRYKRPCINYQLGKCPAPCVGYISRQEYAVLVNQLIGFFQGKYSEIMDDLRNEMLKASEEMQFEQAAKYRDRLITIEKIRKRQTVYYTDQRNIDIIGYYQEDRNAVAIVMRMIDGKILHQENYPLVNMERSTGEETLSAFIRLYYSQKDELPDEILLPSQPADYEDLNAWLKNRLILPQKGDKTKLIAIAKRNAFHLVEESKLAHLRKANRTIFPIQELKEKLNLPKLPRKIVCVDISTIQGSDTVSSAVFFENGKPRKKNYRHFIIRTVQGQDDFASMEESIGRFCLEIDKEKDLQPDLIVIDGGKGQLSSALKVLKDTTYSQIPLISIAKRIEEIFLPGRDESVRLAKSSPALRLITNIRDEAHRFAINFHRRRHSRSAMISELISIHGIGEETMFLLLKSMGSVEAIRSSSLEQLTSIKGIGDVTARLVLDFLNNRSPSTTNSADQH